MIFEQRNKSINTNLNEQSFENLMTGKWQIGLISDNIGLKDINNDIYFKTVTLKNREHRCLKNKVAVRLLDGSLVEKHIIHWVASQNYFCIDNDTFWDQFD